MSGFNPNSKEIGYFERYWEGHNFGDHCREYLEPEPWSYHVMFDYARWAFNGFLRSGNRNLAQRFEDKEFDANEYPDGSVIRFSGESYQKPVLRVFPRSEYYQELDKVWGVVGSFSRRGRRRARIIRFVECEDGTLVPWQVHDPVFRIGEVRHTKNILFPGINEQKLERIYRVELFTGWQGIGEKVQRSLEANPVGLLSPIPMQI